MDPIQHILQFFEYDQMHPSQAMIGIHFHDLAHEAVKYLPAGPELTVCLRKLLESRDAAMRALVAKTE